MYRSDIVKQRQVIKLHVKCDTTYTPVNFIADSSVRNWLFLIQTPMYITHCNIYK